MNRFCITLLFALLAFQSSPSARGQDVPVPDAGLKLAIWIALDEHWPDAGTLTVAHMLRLTDLDASHSDIKSLQGLQEAHNLTFLSLAANHLSTLSLPSGLSLLRNLDLSENVLTNLTLPSDMNALSTLDLGYNNQLRNVEFLGRLTNLTSLSFEFCALTSLTLPPAASSLTNLNVAGNPLQTIVLPQSLVEGALKNSMTALEKAGADVVGYPAEPTLNARSAARSSELQLELYAPPGVYQFQTTSDLMAWHTLNRITNANGTLSFTATIGSSSAAGFFRVTSSD